MAEPTEASLGEQRKNAWDVCPIEDGLIVDMGLSRDAQDPSQVAQVECVESSLLVGVEGQRFTEHAVSVDLHLDLDGQHDVIPGPLSQASHCSRCFANPFVNFSIQGQVGGDRAAEARKVLYDLKDDDIN